ncbi:hypothetical protein ACFFX0_18000 [Citricoccus parietis]|uniref:Uncharacterized protein n=1 Tax=Citricoccus parietis TaxID=592307 RepID=A0ABV5G231_9MICC
MWSCQCCSRLGDHLDRAASWLSSSRRSPSPSPSARECRRAQQRPDASYRQHAGVRTLRAWDGGLCR